LASGAALGRHDGWTGEQLQRPEGYTEAVIIVAFSTDSTRLAIVSRDWIMFTDLIDVRFEAIPLTGP
jgi:hypothetical protein